MRLNEHFKILDSESFTRYLFKVTVSEVHDAGNGVGNGDENTVRNSAENIVKMVLKTHDS